MTKAQRHKIYKEALHRIEFNKEIYMCHAVRKSARIGVRFPIKDGFWERMLLKFPEVMNQKPPKRSFGQEWWKGKTAKHYRIKALKQCIKLTAPKPLPHAKR